MPMPPRQQTGRPPSPVQRAMSALNHVNTPMSCDRCGSLYFFEVPAMSYSRSGYTVRSVSSTSQKALICLCGALQLAPNAASGAPAGSEREIFVHSVLTAQNYHQSNSLNEVARTTASVGEVRTLEAKVQQLETLLQQLTEGTDFQERYDASYGDAGNLPAAYSQEPAYEEEGQYEPQETQEAEPERVSQEVVPPIARGARGRTPAAATSSNLSGQRYIEPTTRAHGTKDGARSRMKRQGE